MSESGNLPAQESKPDPEARQGDSPGPEDELLDDGQEEVFSRYEVEHGLIEHQSEAGGSGAVRKP